MPPWDCPPKLSTKPKIRAGTDLAEAGEFMLENKKSGSVKKVQSLGTKHLVPGFLLFMSEGKETKWRLISDCRELNSQFNTKPFKLDHLQQIFPLLKKGEWGCKIDLKDAYFHVPVNEALKPYLRHKVGNQVWEYQAGPFGLNIMPQVFQGIMKTFEKRWRAKGVQVYIYLDDILLLAPTVPSLEKNF